MEAIAAQVPPSAPLLSRRRTRSYRSLIAAAAAAGLGVAGWRLAAGMGGGDGAPAFATAAAARADLVARVTATGTLSPVVTVDVGSQVSGRIHELHADYNSQVKAGDIIAEIDPQLFASAVAQARARLVSARADHARAVAQAENAKAQHARAVALVARGVGSQADADAARAELRSAEAQVSAAAAAITLARAALEQAQVNLTYTKIASPIDGVVISRSVDVGQTVAASLSAPTLFVIAEDLRNMEVHTSVAESDVGQLTPGMRVEFTVDAFPGETFAGTVKQVRYEATTVSNVVTYDAVVLVDNPERKLRPGMTANVSFVVDERAGALAIPSKALRYRPADADARLAAARASRRGGGERAAGDGARAAGDGDERATRGPRREAGQRWEAGPRGDRGPRREAGEARRARLVWVLRDGQPQPVRVRTGLSDGSMVEVVSGELAEGDPVITGEGDAPTAAEQQPQRRGGRRGPPRVL